MEHSDISSWTKRMMKMMQMIMVVGMVGMMMGAMVCAGETGGMDGERGMETCMERGEE